MNRIYNSPKRQIGYVGRNTAIAKPSFRQNITEDKKIDQVKSDLFRADVEAEIDDFAQKAAEVESKVTAPVSQKAIVQNKATQNAVLSGDSLVGQDLAIQPTPTLTREDLLKLATDSAVLEQIRQVLVEKQKEPEVEKRVKRDMSKFMPDINFVQMEDPKYQAITKKAKSNKSESVATSTKERAVNFVKKTALNKEVEIVNDKPEVVRDSQSAISGQPSEEVPKTINGALALGVDLSLGGETLSSGLGNKQRIPKSDSKIVKKVFQKTKDASKKASRGLVSKVSKAHESIADRFAGFGQRIKLKFRLERKQMTIYSMATLIFVAGIFVAIQGMKTNQYVKEQVKVLSAQTRGDNSQTTQNSTEPAVDIPNEEKPKEDLPVSYRVGPTLPRVISIPSLGVNARVLQVGAKSNNEMATPYSIYDTAWYTGSSKPGEAGAVVINGHRSGPTSNGVFMHIKNLKKGSEIKIEKGDGSVISYSVDSIETKPVDQVDMNKVLSPINKDKPGLNLITCGGKYQAATHDFSDRVVVYATQN